MASRPNPKFQYIVLCKTKNGFDGAVAPFATLSEARDHAQAETVRSGDDHHIFELSSVLTCKIVAVNSWERSSTRDASK